MRHHAADLATEAEVHALFEQHGANPTARLDHPGLDQAIARGRAWANGTAPATTATVTRASALPESDGTGGRRRAHDLTPQALLELSARGVPPEGSPPAHAGRRDAATSPQPQSSTGQVDPSSADRLYLAAWPTIEGT